MRLVCLNTFLRPWPVSCCDDVNTRLELIRTIQADVLCLQEAFRGDFHWTSECGPHFGRYWNNGLRVLASRTEVEFVHAETWDDAASWDWWVPKGFLHVRVQGIHIVNVHLQSEYRIPDDMRHVKAAQLTQLQDYLETIHGPLLVCGDFNMDVNLEHMEKLSGEATNFALYDRHSRRERATRDTPGHGWTPRVVDHVFVRGIRANVRYGPAGYSDHLPLVVDIDA